MLPTADRFLSAETWTRRNYTRPLSRRVIWLTLPGLCVVNINIPAGLVQDLNRAAGRDNRPGILTVPQARSGE